MVCIILCKRRTSRDRCGMVIYVGGWPVVMIKCKGKKKGIVEKC